MLVRFAGPRLAATDDELVPVKLRRGGRILGGTLSWDKPQPLAAFSRESPFANMPVPNDVTVTRQVLAEPDATLPERTWATLADGTPLVTAQRRGKGLIVLFHVTADPRWSNLPLSGSFVDMLRRIVTLAGATAPAANASAAGSTASRNVPVVPPTRILDGFGAFAPPPPTAKPVPTNYTARGNADHPPGFYGPPEGLVAVNTLAPADRPQALDFAPLNARMDVYRHGEPVDLRGMIFLAALALLLIDGLVMIVLSGGFGRIAHAPARDRRALAWRPVGWARVAQSGAGAGAAGIAAMAAPAHAGAAGFRHEGDAAHASCLYRHRRPRRRRSEQGRPARPHAVPGAAYRARSGRADRPRPRARRARLFPADLLADLDHGARSRRRPRSTRSTPT